MPSEAEVQAAVRLEYARRGYRLFRNNLGVAFMGDGRPVRYGLANDSEQLNRRLKSADLVGWHKTLITMEMVGRNVAIFTTFECKPSDWTDRTDALTARYGPNALQRRDLPADARRVLAQRAWLDLVAGDGGEARFVTGVDE